MKRNKFNLSFYHLTTGNMGQILPVGLTEVLPGDTIQQHTNVIVRLSPLAAPIMHNIMARVHHFFVPHRITWPNFEDFITGGEDGEDSQSVPSTIVTPVSWINDRLWDQLGIPAPGGTGVTCSLLPVRAYNAIYNEYYRDQDLSPVIDQNSAQIQNCAWEKDYFTTCRPWDSKGAEVTIPVNATVNDLRKASAIHRFQEARSRYGSRYVEYLKYLGVTPADGRLSRPEFLGGGQAILQISEIMQTAPDETDPTGNGFGVGDLYGHGIAAMRSNKYRRTIEEHGYIMTMLSIRPKTLYVNGMDRTFSRQLREDFFQKELQHIGQQEVYNRELYLADNVTGGEVFGYNDRYSEYKSGRSKVSGNFRDLLD